MKLLIVEDQADLAESICTFLSSAGFICETAPDYASAMEKTETYEYACIVLDINLPGGSGLEILHALKANRQSEGVLIISARNSLDDRVNGLQAGADDYLVKPFHLPELQARVDAIIRRKIFGGNKQLVLGDFILDTAEKTVRINDQYLDLTRKEYDLLLYFASNRNRVISKGALAEHLWGDEMDMSGNYDFLYTHIKNVRKKLVQAGGSDYIKSVYGLGYKFST